MNDQMNDKNVTRGAGGEGRRGGGEEGRRGEGERRGGREEGGGRREEGGGRREGVGWLHTADASDEEDWDLGESPR